jgi:hypothetical protein
MYKWFDRFLPDDVRGWLALGLFALMVYVLSLIAFVDGLDKSQLFTALASGMVGSSFGSLIGYYFATSKGSTDNRVAMQSALDLATANVDTTQKVEATIKMEDSNA